MVKKAPRTKTSPWSASQHLRSIREMLAYLDAALEDGDASLVAAALGDIARARGMTEIASAAGLGRGLATTSPMGAEMTVMMAAIAAAATMAAIVFNMTAPCSGFAPERSLSTLSL